MVAATSNDDRLRTSRRWPSSPSCEHARRMTRGTTTESRLNPETIATTSVPRGDVPGTVGYRCSEASIRPMDESVVVSPDWLASRLESRPSARRRPRPVGVRRDRPHPWGGQRPFDSYRDESDVDRGTLPAPMRSPICSRTPGSNRRTRSSPTTTPTASSPPGSCSPLSSTATTTFVLDGDYSAWNREYETTTAEPEFEPTSYETDPLSGGEPTRRPRGRRRRTRVRRAVRRHARGSRVRGGPPARCRPLRLARGRRRRDATAAI